MRLGVASLDELHVVRRTQLIVHQRVEARRPDGEVRRPRLEQQHHHQHGHRRQQHHDGQHREHHRRRPLHHARPVPPEVVVPWPPVLSAFRPVGPESQLVNAACFLVPDDDARGNTVTHGLSWFRPRDRTSSKRGVRGHCIILHPKCS